MLLQTLICLALILISNAADFVFKPGPLVPTSKGQVWPQPQSVDQLDDKFFTILPQLFYFTNRKSTCSILEEALDRYQHLIAFDSRLIKQIYYQPKFCGEIGDSKYLGLLYTLEVELNGTCDDSQYPSFEMQEDYELIVSANEKKLRSNSLWGILRGLESFSQLIYLTDDYSCHRVETVHIKDYPRFPHRGLLLDTSRHYHSKENILKLLDAMSYNKLNVFHWHLSDDYSFPYVSTSFPELSQKGAFHPKLFIYDQKFVKEVQEYARKRGIRVVAEFDTPGHTLSWGLAYPDLLTACYNVPLLKWGPLDPTKNATYTFMRQLLTEIKSVFKDQYTHLGGDEVDFTCWKSNPEVNRFMEEHNIIGNYEALQSYYFQKIINYADQLNFTSIVWEEVFTNGIDLPQSTIVNAWITDNAKESIAAITAAGYRTLVSNYWYLNLVEDGGDWLRFYNADPLDFPGNAEQKKLVIGGEACMWSEYVDDYNLESRMWPRGSAAAERFWSEFTGVKSQINLVIPVASRLQEHRCRMNRRGIRAQPPNGPDVCF